MALKRDSQGFLIGYPINVGGVESSLGDILEELQGLRRDLTGRAKKADSTRVPATRTSAGTPAAAPRSPRARATQAIAQQRTAVPVRRGATKAALGAPAGAPMSGAGDQSPARRAKGTGGGTGGGTTSGPTATVGRRDQRGRFTRAARAGDAGQGADDEFDGAGEDGARAGLASGIAWAIRDSGRGIAGAITETVEQAEQVDPTVRAMEEVATPVKRVFSTMFGAANPQVRLLRVIYRFLSRKQDAERKQQKQQQRTLQDIHEEVAKDKDGGHWPFLGMLIAPLVGLASSLGGALLGLLGLLGGLPMLLRGLLGGLGLGKFMLPMLRKVPVLGMVLSALGIGADVLASETGDGSRRDKDIRTGRAVGGGLGVIGGGLVTGGMAGSAFGPVGAIIGAIAGAYFGGNAGEVIGSNVGQWVNDLRDADVPGKILGAWNRVTEMFSGAAGWLNEWIRDKTGIDIGEAISEGSERASDLAERSAGAIKDFTEEAARTITDAAETAFRWLSGGMTNYREFGEGWASGPATGTDRPFSGNVDAAIRDAARETGVDENFLRLMARIESGGNPNAVSTTGATGLYQFTQATGRQYGLIGPGGDRRNDARANALAAARLARDNRERLRRGFRGMGLGEPTDFDLYMAHQQGAAGWLEIRRAALNGGRVSNEVRRNMDVNGGRDRSASEFARHWRQTFENKARRGGYAITAGNLTPSAAAPTAVQPAQPTAGASAPPPVPAVPPRPPQASAMPEEVMAPMAANRGSGGQGQGEGEMVSRDISDRRLAHLVTGGYSTGGGY